jgi:hypothetical protein
MALVLLIISVRFLLPHSLTITLIAGKVVLRQTAVCLKTTFPDISIVVNNIKYYFDCLSKENYFLKTRRNFPGIFRGFPTSSFI